MNTNHTPGPWKHYKRSSTDPDELHRFFIGQPEGNNHIIANTVKEYASIDDEANARLLAAAPDLLKALIDLLEDVEFAQPKIESGLIGNRQIRHAREAIAKATA
jgi:hypothetical protein